MTENAPSLAAQAEELAVNAVRILSMDAVQKAKSGHPGTPMALAPLCYVLYTRHLRHDPRKPDWYDRDRFVLSCGHASMLLYSVLHLSGYDLSLEDIQDFRQFGSKTPGHPEYRETPGVETTTGPLGQGTANAVGFAMAEAQLAARFNHTGHYIVDHHTWFIASDGDLMEGVSQEAASLAGHLGLGKLIGFYDANDITIEGRTNLAMSEDVGKRYEALGWSVSFVEDGNDLGALDDAIDAAKAELDKPSLIIVKTTIAYGSPNKADRSAAHGAPLGEEEIALTREQLGWSWKGELFVPQEARDPWERCVPRGAELRAEWKKIFGDYKRAFPAEVEDFERCMRGELPEGWDKDLPDYDRADGSMATRVASGEVLNALAAKIPELLGGSADLGPSNNTVLKGLSELSKDEPGGRNIHWGVREHAMGGAINGMALHGGVIPYGASFLMFADYMRPALRLAALMKLPTKYVFTHDSIGLGEDGPTHQPIESLTALRCIPGFTVLRPADAAETCAAWRYAMEKRDGPVALCLSRQKLPHLDRSSLAPSAELVNGGYVLIDAASSEPELTLLASGSEVSLALDVHEALTAEGREVRVVSMPSQELFLAQDEGYREDVLGKGKRLAIEAGHPMSWFRFVGTDGDVVGIERFGASAPAEQLFEHYGFSVDAILERARALLS